MKQIPYHKQQSIFTENQTIAIAASVAALFLFATIYAKENQSEDQRASDQEERAWVNESTRERNERNENRSPCGCDNPREFVDSADYNP